MNLYQISKDLFEQLSTPGVDLETGEVDQEAYMQRLDNLQMCFDDKALNVAKFIKSLEAESEAIKQAIDSMKERITTNNKRVAYLEKYLTNICLQQGRFPQDAQVKLGVRKSSRVIIDDESAIPPEFLKIQMVESLDKTMISQKLKAGEEVPGAHMETMQNLQIK